MYFCFGLLGGWLGVGDFLRSSEFGGRGNLGYVLVRESMRFSSSTVRLSWLLPVGTYAEFMKSFQDKVRVTTYLSTLGG